MLPTLIMVTSIATSSTGGNYASPGGVVDTGSQSASSYVETHVDAGGTSTVNIGVRADDVGTTTTQVVAPASLPARIEVHATSHSAPSASQRANAHRTVATSTAATSSVSVSASNEATSTGSSSLVVPPPSAMVPPPIALQLVRVVINFIRSLFSFVR